MLALTATATPAVVADIRAGFGIEEADAVVTGFYRPNLTLLTDAGRSRRARPSCWSSGCASVRPARRSCTSRCSEPPLRIAEQLADAGLPARPYHAGMEH